MLMSGAKGAERGPDRIAWQAGRGVNPGSGSAFLPRARHLTFPMPRFHHRWGWQGFARLVWLGGRYWHRDQGLDPIPGVPAALAQHSTAFPILAGQG